MDQRFLFCLPGSIQTAQSNTPTKTSSSITPATANSTLVGVSSYHNEIDDDTSTRDDSEEPVLWSKKFPTMVPSWMPTADESATTTNDATPKKHFERFVTDDEESSIPSIIIMNADNGIECRDDERPYRDLMKQLGVQVKPEVEESGLYEIKDKNMLMENNSKLLSPRTIRNTATSVLKMADNMEREREREREEYLVTVDDDDITYKGGASTTTTAYDVTPDEEFLDINNLIISGSGSTVSSNTACHVNMHNMNALRQKHRASERNIIRLARGLLDKRDDTIVDQEKIIGRLKEQLVIERTEKMVLERRLLQYNETCDIERNYSLQEMEKDLVETRKRFADIRGDFERRIDDLIKSHAQQCDSLCREIIELHNENAQLREQLLAEQQQSRKQASSNGLLSLRVLLGTFAGYSFFESNGGVVTPSNRHGTTTNRQTTQPVSFLDVASNMIFPFPRQEMMMETTETANLNSTSNSGGGRISNTVDAAEEPSTIAKVVEELNEGMYIEEHSEEADSEGLVEGIDDLIEMTMAETARFERLWAEEEKTKNLTTSNTNSNSSLKASVFERLQEEEEGSRPIFSPIKNKCLSARFEQTKDPSCKSPNTKERLLDGVKAEAQTSKSHLETSKSLFVGSITTPYEWPQEDVEKTYERLQEEDDDDVELIAKTSTKTKKKRSASSRRKQIVCWLRRRVAGFGSTFKRPRSKYRKVQTRSSVRVNSSV